MTEKLIWGGRIVIILLLFSFFAFSNQESNIIYTVNAASGSFSEDFTTTTYMDTSETNITGWGTGSIENIVKKPSIIGSINSALIGNVIDVFIDGDYAYVTNEDEGLKVVNITDPTSPFIIGSYDTDDIAQSVYVDGDYAFIADYAGDPFIEENVLILDVSDPTNPTHLGNCSSIEAAGDYAWDIISTGDIAYLANGDGGLNVIDVSTPSSPEIIERRNTPGISYDLDVDGDYLYLADDDNGLVVLDITNPSSIPIPIATYNTGMSSAVSVTIEGNFAYVADINNGLFIINITDPTNPILASFLSENGISDSFVYGDFLYVTDTSDGLLVVDITDPFTPYIINSIPLPGFTNNIVIEGCFAYLPCQTGGFQIVRIADPTSPSFVGWFDTPGYALDVVVSGDYAYIADHNASVQILDISDPSSPSFAGFYDLPHVSEDVFVFGDYLYVADYSNGGLQILDITDPTSPSFVGWYDTTVEAESVFVTGDYAFVAEDKGDGNGRIEILDISNPSSPSLVSMYDLPSPALDVIIKGDFAFVADWSSGLQILNISDPSSPSIVGTYDTPHYAWRLSVYGDLVYIADGTSGLQIVNITNPSTPSLTGSFDTPGNAHDVHISGDFAYIADLDYGLQIVDISDPSSPIFVDEYITPVPWSWGIYVSGDYAYLADHIQGGLQIIEVRKNRAHQFDSPCIAQSEVIPTGSGSYTLLNGTIIPAAIVPIDTSITYYLSADNGANWEIVTPGIDYSFINSGFQLKWKAVLSTSNITQTPKINSIFIEFKTVLNSPSLSNPLDNAIVDDYTPSFTWDVVSGASEYLFQLDTSTSFTTPILNITLPSSSTSYTPSSILATNTYYWRVAGIDSDGDIGDFSVYRTLNIVQDTNAPTINNPTDVSYELGTTGNTITWLPSDSNPNWYNITLNGILTSHDDPWNGGNIVMNIDGLPLGTYTVICNVYDYHGLMNSDSVDIEVVSTAPPTIDDIIDFDYEEDSTGNSITWHPTDTNPDYYSITRDGFVIDDGPWSGGDININIDGLAYGSYTYVCFVNDTEGQSASDSVEVTVTDNAAPILNSPSDVIYTEGDTGNNIIWIATDNNPATYVVYKDGVSYDTNTWTSGLSIVVSIDGLSSSQYNFTIVVVDQAGNSEKDTVIVGVTAAVTEFNLNFLYILVFATIVNVIHYIYRRKQKNN